MAEPAKEMVPFPLTQILKNEAFVFKYITLLLSSFFLTSCLAPMTAQKLSDKGALLLSAEQVVLLTENNTLHMSGHSLSGDFYFDQSSRVFGRDLDNFTDQGRWDVSVGGELCLKFNKWWYGDIKCYSVYQKNGKHHLADELGVLLYTVSKMEGDAKKLYKEPRKRASVRKSARKAAPVVTQSEQVHETEKSQGRESGHSRITDIIEQDPLGSLKAERDVYSTVRWMAKNCPNCNLTNVDLSNADLVEANLAGAILAGANLSNANLRRANLQGADLEGAKLVKSDLPGANLKNSTLDHADLTGANLFMADITGASLNGITFSPEQLQDLKGSTP